MEICEKHDREMFFSSAKRNVKFYQFSKRNKLNKYLIFHERGN